MQPMKKAVSKSILLSHHFNYFSLSTEPLFTSCPWKPPCPHLYHCSIFSYSSPLSGYNLLMPSHPLHSPMTTDFLKRPVSSSKSLFRCHFYCGSYRDTVNSIWPYARQNQKVSVFSDSLEFKYLPLLPARCLPDEVFIHHQDVLIQNLLSQSKAVIPCGETPPDTLCWQPCTKIILYDAPKHFPNWKRMLHPRD